MFDQILRELASEMHRLECRFVASEECELFILLTERVAATLNITVDELWEREDWGDWVIERVWL